MNAALQMAQMPLFTPMGLMNANKAVAGVNIGHLWNEMEMLHEELVALVELYRKGAVKPRIDQVFKFDQVADAHRRISRARTWARWSSSPDHTQRTVPDAEHGVEDAHESPSR